MSRVARALYQLGVDAHRRGDWDQAIAHYHHALQLIPQSASLHYHLGLLFDQQHRLAFAIEHYRQTIALVPHHQGAMENLGCAYLKQGQVDQAIAKLQQAIAAISDSASLWNNFGQALKADGQEEAAIAAYERAIQLQPDLVAVHLNLGYVWSEQGQIEKAIAQFRHILALSSDHLLAHSHCAQLYFQQGKLAVAVAHWRAIATRQQHLLRPYCQTVWQEQRQFRQSQIPSDLRHQARQFCAQFLQALLNQGTVKDIGHYLQQTYECLGRLVMEDDGATLADYYFRQALLVQPDDAGLLLNLSQALAQQQRSEGAIALHCLAQMLQPSSPLTPNPFQKNASTPIRLYCQSTTADWVNTTVTTPVYRPVAWPFSSSLYPSNRPLHDLPTPPYPSPSLCGGVTCHPCMTTLRNRFQPYLVRPHILNCRSNEVEPEVLAPHPRFSPFVVTVPHGRCWVEPHRNSWAICDNIAVITADRTLLHDLSRCYPWVLPGCQRPQQDYHQFFKAEPSLPPVRVLEGRVALLSGLSGHIYYHWMIDVLPRLAILRQGGWQWSEIDAIVVNSMQRPFQRETLAILGVPDEKIIESDRHPHLQAQELIVPSFPGYLDWVPKATVEFLRSHFLLAITQITPPAPFSVFPPYLYISRSGASYRRLVNEPELLQQLQPLGFVAIALETLTVRQQVALFAHAKIVVAPHGAGLTNIVFCQPGTQVVEIAAPHYVRSDYWIVSHQAGLDHYLVTGQTVNCALFRQVMYQNPLTEDIWLPEDTIQSMLALFRDMI